MNRFRWKLNGLFILMTIFLFTFSTNAETVDEKSASAIGIPVNIESDTIFYTDTKREFKCAIKKDWLRNEVNEYAIIFYSPDERFFVNFSCNPLRAIYNNVPQEKRRLSWKEFFDTMTNKNVFEQFSKDIALQSSQSIAKNAKIISSQETKIAGLPAILTKVEGAMPEKNMQFEARDITFIDKEDIFTIDCRAFFTGNKSPELEKEFSSIIKQIFNTFETTKK
jgi:L-rhamnose mutarotase